MIKQATAGNRKIIYETRGQGAPAFFIHGFTEDRRIWSATAVGLENKYRLILPDLPGSGDSPAGPAGNVDMEGLAEALEAIRAAEVIGSFALIGHSMGGYVALAYAEKYGERLSGLGLFHSTAFADSAPKKASREKNIDFIRRQGAGPFVRQSLPGLYSDGFRATNPEEIARQTERYANLDPENLVQYLEAMKARPDRTAVLGWLDVPVLVIAGEDDKAVPLAESLAQCQIPRISYFHILSRAAHMGMVEDPILCNSFLDRFLDQVTR